MNKDYKDIMSKYSDDELIKIVTTERESYEKEAVEAAQKEINARNIDHTQFEKIKNKLQSDISEKFIFRNLEVSLMTRFVHMIIDTIAFVALAFVIIFFLSPLDFLFEHQFSLYLIGAVFLSSFFIYYIFMESKYQKTIGKFLTKSKVVTLNGEKPEQNVIIQRTILRFFPFDNISFLFKTNGFHDKLSKTIVIKDLK